MTMKSLITATDTFGPFLVIETLSDRYRCDDIEFPFGVIGSATIGDWVDPPPPPPPPLPVPREISKLQLLLGAQSQGMITGAEALALVQVGTVPAVIDDIFNGLSPTAAMNARIRFIGMTKADRYDDLTGVIQFHLDLTDAQMDDLWRAWSQL